MNREIIEYCICYHTSLDILSQRVNDKIKEGFVPHGNLSLDKSGGVQAMVKYGSVPTEFVAGKKPLND